jgi:regulator of cell morphogenesis and NO signaling
MNHSIHKKTLAQIVTLNPAAAALFEKYELDFCCKGKRTISEACQEDVVKQSTIEHELEKIFAADLTLPDDKLADKMETTELIDYIISTHHHYVKETMPMIYAHLDKVNNKHGEKHPELTTIFRLFGEVKSELDVHLYKEENILFPRILEMNDALQPGNVHVAFIANYLGAPIQVMIEEHEKAGGLLQQIKQLTSNYTPPESACTTYRLSFNELREFEYDLHRHIHLENNILFPRAFEIQEKLKQVLVN